MRVLWYAFWRESGVETTKMHSDALEQEAQTHPTRVYKDYLCRWTTEEVHRDLKKRFGFNQSQRWNDSIV